MLELTKEETQLLIISLQTLYDHWQVQGLTDKVDKNALQSKLANTIGFNALELLQYRAEKKQ